jgi:hypothetical protein
MYFRARTAQSATGASLFGSDLSEWPALAVDVFCVLQQEEAAVEELLQCNDSRHNRS